MTKVYLNGKIVPAAAAKISVYDRGFLYGDGLFETLTTQGRRPVLLDEHLKRLLLGAERLKLRVPLSLAQLRTAVFKTIAANNFKEYYLKIVVSRGALRGHGLDPRNAAGRPTVLVLCEDLKPYPASLYVKGWHVIISKVIRPSVPTSKLKSLCYADNMLALLEAKQAGADEAFLPDENGQVVEGSASNFFIVKHRRLLTPPAAEPILPGITRGLVIKLAERSGWRVEEKPISPKELYNCDECFATMSGAGLVPVTAIGRRKIGRGVCGPLTKQLINLYQAEIIRT